MVKQFPHLTEKQIEDISKSKSDRTIHKTHGYGLRDDNDHNKVSILYFNYKTYIN